jgi:hypothetical protein
MLHAIHKQQGAERKRRATDDQHGPGSRKTSGCMLAIAGEHQGSDANACPAQEPGRCELQKELTEHEIEQETGQRNCGADDPELPINRLKPNCGACRHAPLPSIVIAPRRNDALTAKFDCSLKHEQALDCRPAALGRQGRS